MGDLGVNIRVGNSAAGLESQGRDSHLLAVDKQRAASVTLKIPKKMQ